MIAELGQSPDLQLTGRGWRRIKKAWNKATPEERKSFGVAPEILRMTRADAQAAIRRRQIEAQVAARMPRKKKVRERISGGWLRFLSMLGIMGAARRPQLPTKARRPGRR